MSKHKTQTNSDPDGTDTYFELVKEFPLRSITNLKELRSAYKVLDRLLTREPLDNGEDAYLEALSDLIAHYEEHNVELPKASDADILRHLLESNGLTQSQLSLKLNIPKSTISSLVKGSRKMNRDHIDAISKWFKVSRDTFSR